MSGRYKSSNRLATLAAVAAFISTGCARLVTTDRETVARRADPGWKIRKSPDPGAGAAPASVPSSSALNPTTVPFHKRPEVANALQSPPDGYGIPTDLYTVDPLLVAQKREMVSEASARHLSGAGVIVLGILAGAVSGFDLWYASSHKGAPNSGQLYFWGGMSGLLSLGCLVGGITVASRGSDSNLLENYYRETYGH